MKKFIILLVISLSAIIAHAESLFESCENTPGITTVYVSKTMISLAGDLDIGSDNMNLSSIASKIDGIWIMTAEGDKAAILRNKVKNAFNDKKYEKLMSVRDDGDNVDILMATPGGNKNECIIKAIAETDATVIIMRGSFTLQDIVAATKAAH